MRYRTLSKPIKKRILYIKDNLFIIRNYIRRNLYRISQDYSSAELTDTNK